MAKLSGIEIYKQLPRTNCGDCGVPTCMAFAMQVAGQKAALDVCPHVSQEAMETLGAAQAPPMSVVTLGTGERELEIGGETVLFRHEARFQHPTAFALRMGSDVSDEQLASGIAALDELRFDRIGRTMGIDMAAVECVAGAEDRFADVVDRVTEATDVPLLLMCEDPTTLAPVAERHASRRPLLSAASSENAAEMLKLAARLDLPLVIRAEHVDELAELSQRTTEAGVKERVLELTAQTASERLAGLISLRRLAIEERVQSLGFPSLVSLGTNCAMDAMTDGIGVISRYAGLVVVESIEPWAVLALATARLNLYTDPQVPNAVEAKLYEIGDPGPDAPVLVTTNFALTYFTVAGEVENSGVDAFICVMDTEGLGVLNAYADRQLTAETLTEAIRAQGGMERVKHNRLIIPGLIARLRVAIEEASGWDVVIGPEDASGIPLFLREVYGSLETHA